MWEDVMVFTSPIRRVGDNRPNYLYCERGNHIYFKTIKDRVELGDYDKNQGILYFNSDYRMQYKAIKRQIIKDYQPKKVSEYLNLKGLGI